MVETESPAPTQAQPMVGSEAALEAVLVCANCNLQPTNGQPLRVNSGKGWCVACIKMAATITIAQTALEASPSPAVAQAAAAQSPTTPTAAKATPKQPVSPTRLCSSGISKSGSSVTPTQPASLDTSIGSPVTPTQPASPKANGLQPPPAKASPTLPAKPVQNKVKAQEPFAGQAQPQGKKKAKDTTKKVEVKGKGRAKRAKASPPLPRQRGRWSKA